MFNEIDFRPELAAFDRFVLFRPCRPKVLVVTDGLNFAPDDDFGLTQFVDTLAGSPIYGMTPTIVKAHRGVDGNADIQGFRFNDSSHGLTINRYDVVFLLGFGREGAALPAAELDAVKTFMQAGGGVFATGDHEDLGAGMSKDLPRVREMRYWLDTETPDFRDDTRLSTNLPGDNDIYEFDDQADTHPQRLYVNYRTDAGGIGEPHPLLQGGRLGPIEVFPDHPHEGECHLPSDLTTTFALGAANHDEWPQATVGGGRVVPEMVAMSMSHGDAFPGKDPLVPRSFMSIVAYDGHRARVGRVSTDATWHHFVNVNIDGTDSPRDGLQSPPGTDTPEMTKIRQYYKNLASWLMPKRRRLCLAFPWVIAEVLRYPLFEEIRVPVLKEAGPEWLHRLGEQVSDALGMAHPGWQAKALEADALELAIGEESAARLLGLGRGYGRLSGREVALSALGGLVISAIETTVKVRDKQDIDVDKAYVPGATQAAKLAVERYRQCSLEQIQSIQDLFQQALGGIAASDKSREPRAAASA